LPTFVTKAERPMWGNCCPRRALPIEFPPTSMECAEVAADFKARFRLSLADAFAAALAKECRAELVAGDPECPALGNEVEIRWLPFAPSEPKRYLWPAMDLVFGFRGPPLTAGRKSPLTWSGFRGIKVQRCEKVAQSAGR